MLVNRENLAAMFRGFSVIYQEAWQQAPSHYLRVATEVPSQTSEEQYGWLGTLPRFREWVGDRVLQSLKASDYTIKNKSYENTIEIDRDDIEDDKLGIYKPALQMMADQSKTHPDELVFAAMLAGFTTACFDGQYFFDTDHPIELADGTMGTWSNHQGGAGTPWFLLDVRRPLKPIIFQKRKDYTPVAMTDETDESVFMRKKFRYGVDARVNVGYGLPHLAYASKQTLDVTNYSAARASMASTKGDKGKPLAINGNLLVVPPSLEKAALEVVKADRNANGATNVMQGTAEVMVCPWLA
jgi:phage major head subunit gpT-like protein